MKLSAKERSVAIALFSSSAVQAIADLGQWKIAGEPGTIAHRCAEAARVFVRVAQEIEAGPQQVAVALSAFVSSVQSFLMSGESERVARIALARSVDMLSYIELEDGKLEPVLESAPQGDAASSEGDPPQPSLPVVTDVPTEKLDLPAKTIEQLLSQSTPEADLSTALKLRAFDHAKGLESLTHVGETVARKIREAIDKAVGPVAAS